MTAIKNALPTITLVAFAAGAIVLKFVYVYSNLIA